MIKNHIDYWQDVKNATMVTINKMRGRYPDSEWKLRLLLSEHSPIRKIKINYIWLGLKSWVSVHYTRHSVGISHFVSTSRTDRTGIDRDKLPQSNPVNHEFEANAQAIINISQKRLCFQASKDTTDAWIKFLEDLKEVEPDLYQVCVPSCIYRCGCPEVFGCPFFAKFSEDISKYDLLDIKTRYSIYIKNREIDYDKTR